LNWLVQSILTWGLNTLWSIPAFQAVKGLDINFYPPFLSNGKDCQKCTGEALFTYNGKPILLVTRTYAENGADATTAKLYRKQYWYEKVKSYNSHFSHVTFVTSIER